MHSTCQKEALKDSLLQEYEKYDVLLATPFWFPWKQKTKDLQKDIFPIDRQVLMKL